LKAARRAIYAAALQTLEDYLAQAEGERQAGLKRLRAEFEVERARANVDDAASLLPQLMAGDHAALRQVVSSELLDELAGRIADGLGQAADPVRRRARYHFATIVGTSDRWRAFARSFELGGIVFSSRFAPINAAFDPAFSGYGLIGYGSLTAGLPVGQEAPLESRRRATNAWHSELWREGDRLVAAFRSGSFSEPALEDAGQRQALARAKCADLLKAMAVEHFRSSGPAERAAILRGAPAEIAVVSTTLLTSLWGQFNHQALLEHAEALESYHGAEIDLDVWVEAEPRSIRARFSVSQFNKAVNEMRWFGASRSRTQLDMNAKALKRLRALVEQRLADLQAEAGSEERLALTRQLWARLQSVTARWGGLRSGSGSAYELPALVTNLGYQLGAAAHYACLSGKDRTGIADVEAKLLAYQMDQRVREARGSGTPLAHARLVPHYTGRMSEGDGEAAVRLLFESGNLEIQQINTGVAGYKIRGGLRGRFGDGRLGRILATGRAQAVLREYLNGEAPAAIDAQAFSRLINGLSIFTGA
jgi:hypothetical protein